MARDEGLAAAITDETVAQEISGRSSPVAVGTAIDRILRRSGCNKWKSEDGGRYLADWALEVNSPPEKATGGSRHVMAVWQYLHRGQNRATTGRRFNGPMLMITANFSHAKPEMSIRVKRSNQIAHKADMDPPSQRHRYHGVLRWYFPSVPGGPPAQGSP